MSTRTPMSVQDSLWLTMDRPNNLMIIDGVLILAGRPGRDGAAGPHGGRRHRAVRRGVRPASLGPGRRQVEAADAVGQDADAVARQAAQHRPRDVRRGAEQASGSSRAGALSLLATQLSSDAGTSSDSGKVGMLVSTVRSLAGM